MRYLMRIVLPDTANAAVSDQALTEKFHRLFAQIGAQSAYCTLQDGRRVDWAVIDIAEPVGITPVAEAVFRKFKAKTEFLSEVLPQPYFGRQG